MNAATILYQPTFGFHIRYALHWLIFKTTTLFHPYVSITPAAACPFSLRRDPWGFTMFRDRNRILVSWRTFAEGPCNKATYYWLHHRNKP